MMMNVRFDLLSSKVRKTQTQNGKIPNFPKQKIMKQTGEYRYTPLRKNTENTNSNTKKTTAHLPCSLDKRIPIKTKMISEKAQKRTPLKVRRGRVPIQNKNRYENNASMAIYP